jgi:DNA-binding beta-propeller fold protein YncE
MQSKRRLILLVAAFTVVFGFLTIAAPLFAASKEKVLYSFMGMDGAFPTAGLIFDGAGNLYGTTDAGGASGANCVGFIGCGTVFELTAGANGTWTEKVLHSFQNNGKDGTIPVGGLIFDAAGNLYGTTLYGGTSGTGCNGLGCGTVFELTPGRGGKWTEKVLHNFNGGDGAFPEAGLILDAAGNLYGTTLDGGAFGSYSCGIDGTAPCGTVFELKPGTSGKWNEKVLHSFGRAGDGFGPWGGLIFDAAGNNLYSTTAGGGTSTGCYGCGTAFELTPGANGKWKEKLLHSFGNGEDGVGPYGVMVFDATGNLYGTTTEGGAGYVGTFFQLAPGANGKWKEKVLHSFCLASGCRDGEFPRSGLIFNAAGNLYGTTGEGGDPSCGSFGYGCGTAFEFMPEANGKWQEKVLHRFTGGKDGAYPDARLIFDAVGNLYGATASGGTYGYGTVFEITP